MPVYVYRCECGQEREAFLKLDEAHKAIQCPKCAHQMKKVPSTRNFTLKGEKWFKNSGEY